MMKMLHNRVLVKPAPFEEKTPGGIIIPDTSKKQHQRGTVVSAGPQSTLSVGDTILFPEFHGAPVDLNGEKFLVMKDSDIFCVI